MVSKQDEEDEKQQEGQVASQAAVIDLGKLSPNALKEIPIWIGTMPACMRTYSLHTLLCLADGVAAHACQSF